MNHILSRSLTFRTHRAGQKDRTALASAFDSLHVSASNPFSIAEFDAVCREGAEWPDELPDCRAMGMSDKQPKHFFVQQAELNKSGK